MQDILQQDRFFVDGDSILWMYYNPDAVSGDQFVSNCFGVDLLKEAMIDGEEIRYEDQETYDILSK